MSLVVYGISFGITSLAGNLYVNMLLMAVIEIPGLPLTFWLMNKYVHSSSYLPSGFISLFPSLYLVWRLAISPFSRLFILCGVWLPPPPPSLSCLVFSLLSLPPFHLFWRLAFSLFSPFFILSGIWLCLPFPCLYTTCIIPPLSLLPFSEDILAQSAESAGSCLKNLGSIPTQPASFAC